MKIVILSFVLICFVFAPETFAHPSWAIVADDKNQVYVSDLEKIWKIDARGAVSVFSERHTHEMTLDSGGNLTGEDLHYEPATRKFTSALWKITPNGEFSYILAPTDAPPKGISIWKNASGATFYFGQTDAEPRENFLLKRTASGEVAVLLGDRQKALQHRQIVPYSFAGMTFAPDGSLYVKNADTVWKVTTNDAVSVFLTKEQMSAIAPKMMLFGLAVDAENNVYTTDHNNKKTLKIAPDKKISVVFQTEPNWSPTGVFYRNKNLYVLEYKSAPSGGKPVVRVQRIAADGKVSTLVTIGENKTAAPIVSVSGDANKPGEQTFKSCAPIGLALAVAAGLLIGKENDC